MKHLFAFVFAFFCFFVFEGKAQVVSTKKHKIVLQLSNGDTAVHRMVIRQIGNLKKAAPNAEIEVVCHGAGIYILVGEKTTFQKEIEEYAKNKVVWAACENTMSERKITRDKLLAVCTTVPSGMFELVLKQEDGWSYLKIGY